jgi:hypothetical protein
MRRHPDLIVHRISKPVLHNSQKDKEANFPAKHSSFSSESGGHEFNRAEKLGGLRRLQPLRSRFAGVQDVESS